MPDAPYDIHELPQGRNQRLNDEHKSAEFSNLERSENQANPRRSQSIDENLASKWNQNYQTTENLIKDKENIEVDIEIQPNNETEYEESERKRKEDKKERRRLRKLKKEAKLKENNEQNRPENEKNELMTQLYEEENQKLYKHADYQFDDISSSQPLYIQASQDPNLVDADKVEIGCGIWSVIPSCTSTIQKCMII